MFLTHSDWLLKLRILSAIHLLALLWVLHPSFSSFFRKIGTIWCWLSTALVNTKTVIKYPPLFTSTLVNNCYLFRTDKKYTTHQHWSYLILYSHSWVNWYCLQHQTAWKNFFFYNYTELNAFELVTCISGTCTALLNCDHPFRLAAISIQCPFNCENIYHKLENFTLFLYCMSFLTPYCR